MNDIEKLNSVKFNIRKALESQGSDITVDTPFEEYPKYVMELDSGGVEPTGTITITENGTVDVTEYAEADVNVPSAGATWPITITCAKDSASNIIIYNQYNLNKNGYYSVDGQYPGSIGFTISKGRSQTFQRANFYSSSPDFVGNCLYDYIIVGAVTSSLTTIEVTSSNCTVSTEAIYTQSNKIRAVFVVKGYKNGALVSEPSITIKVT